MSAGRKRPTSGRIICATPRFGLQTQLQTLLLTVAGNKHVESVRTLTDLQAILATLPLRPRPLAAQPAFVLLDTELPDITDALLLDIVGRTAATHRVVIVDARQRFAFGAKLLALGAAGFIDPALPDDLLNQALRHHLLAAASANRI